MIPQDDESLSNGGKSPDRICAWLDRMIASATMTIARIHAHLLVLLTSGLLGIVAAGAAPRSLDVQATAYTHTDPSQAPWGKKNAIGTVLRFGKVTSAASDWSILPLGTRFKIKGTERVYEIDDYGSGMVGKKKVDLYRPNRKMMNAWGKRRVEIEILKWGSFEKSLKILKPRSSKNRHIRQMVSALRRKLS